MDLAVYVAITIRQSACRMRFLKRDQTGSRSPCLRGEIFRCSRGTAYYPRPRAAPTTFRRACEVLGTAFTAKTPRTPRTALEDPGTGTARARDNARDCLGVLAVCPWRRIPSVGEMRLRDSTERAAARRPRPRTAASALGRGSPTAPAWAGCGRSKRPGSQAPFSRPCTPTVHFVRPDRWRPAF